MIADFKVLRDYILQDENPKSVVPDADHPAPTSATSKQSNFGSVRLVLDRYASYILVWFGTFHGIKVSSSCLGVWYIVCDRPGVGVRVWVLCMRSGV